MRKPSEFVASAVRNIRLRCMPECAMTLECGADSATVSRISSSSRGEDGIVGDGPDEALRVLALAADFPKAERHDFVRLDGDPRIVTSVKMDATRSALTIGLSEPLSKITADYAGVRGARRLRFPIDILAACGGLSPDPADAYAPTAVYAWTLCISADAWPYADAPQIGDELRFEKDGEQRVRVSRVVAKDNVFTLTARSR